MTKILTEALEAAHNLPDGLQDEIGRTILDHVQRLVALQEEIGRGIAGLAEGGGRELNDALWKEMKEEAKRRAFKK